MEFFLGIDIGSTTVKYLITNSNFEIIAKDYKPHNTKQAETLLEMLSNLDEELKQVKRAYITGSGASKIAPLINAKFIQEVNAVVLSVEKLHPDVNAVIELGGQDAKIMHFKIGDDGKKRTTTSMNDKCASGTGATIEKCSAKIGLNNSELANIEFNNDKLHNVAAKCGVFAETDIVNLLKASIPQNEIMNSLADAIVMQNLTVLTRGNTLKPKVILLGGPNKYLPFLQKAWRVRIAQIWDERGVKYDKERLQELIFTPQNAEYYAALGSIIFGENELEKHSNFAGLKKLQALVNGELEEGQKVSSSALVKSQEELDEFLKEYKIPPFKPTIVSQKTKCYLGIDGGSTSSKAVLIDERTNVLFKAYQLSRGNPIEDILELFKQIDNFNKNGLLEIAGFGATGYAANVLDSALKADANIIETIAHLKSAKEIFGDSIDVLCDVGGQDIKVLFIENGMLKNFRLSNQCSAGNGALIQSMAKQFGVELQDFANVAFSAKRAPNFNYGCAVFLDTDRVNFQKEGYTQAELFAGIANVLPKNIWQYIVQAPSLEMFGKHFVLQGGTQYNLAALKAQVDYIKSQVKGAIVNVHPHCGEAGAIGAAIEARDQVQQRGYSKFVGLQEALGLEYSSKTDASTQCHFCPMNCNRTFIDTKTPNSDTVRYIAGFSCEKGTVESKEQLKEIKQKRENLDRQVQNMVSFEAKELFNFNFMPNPIPSKNKKISKKLSYAPLGSWGPTINFNIKSCFKRSSNEDSSFRRKIKIAMPRVLNIYSKAPFFINYLKTLGIMQENIIFSQYSSEKLFLNGAKYGSVDPCYPAKVVQSHVHSLMFHKKYQNKKINYIWNPTINEIDGFVEHTIGNTACPIVSGTPKVVYSAFVKEQDIFKKNGVKYIDTTVTFTNLKLLAKQLFQTWGEALKITEDESNFALSEALRAQKKYEEKIENMGKEILQDAIKNKEIVVLLLGRPYHLDPGINHEILTEFQNLGFKILTINAIPKDPKFLTEFFKKDLEKGYIESVFDIRDVWQENFSTNSTQKVWAAKFAARCPNISVVDISSFKCGHDAPTYGIIDKILSASRTPHLMLHDLDANKPSGSINIRIQTFAYTLNEYTKEL